MERRTLLTVGLGLAAAVLTGFRPAAIPTQTRSGRVQFLLADMEPDGLTQTYRRYRLLLVGQRDDEIASDLSRSAVDMLARYLPASRAKLVRAADTRRVGVLIGTHQQDIAIMTRESAETLLFAEPPFSDIREVPLRVIVCFERHVLVCRSDFSDRHAYVVAKTLAEHEDILPAPATEPIGIIPAHPGSQAYFAGADMPEN